MTLDKPSLQIDHRAQILLKSLVEQYILDGRPVGSQTLSRHSSLNISPASVRNIMAELEEHGFLSSPHISAGRIPTDQGYRFFVDSLLTLHSPNADVVENLSLALHQEARPQQLIHNASELLARLTQLAGLVAAPYQVAQRIKHMEFIPLTKGRTLLILVNEHGEVQNRVLRTEKEYTPTELQDLGNFVSENYHLLTLEEIHQRLSEEIRHLRSNMDELVRTIFATEPPSPEVVVKGEHQLLYIDDWVDHREQLQQLFSLLQQKSHLAQLLELSTHTAGVKIFIGRESGFAALEGCSVVASPYVVNDQVVGALCVIGPTRMQYQKVIPIVAVTAQALSSALSNL